VWKRIHAFVYEERPYPCSNPTALIVRNSYAKPLKILPESVYVLLRINPDRVGFRMMISESVVFATFCSKEPGRLGHS
jgi:hypothetical protein